MSRLSTGLLRTLVWVVVAVLFTGCPDSTDSPPVAESDSAVVENVFEAARRSIVVTVVLDGQLQNTETITVELPTDSRWEVASGSQVDVDQVLAVAATASTDVERARRALSRSEEDLVAAERSIAPDPALVIGAQRALEDAVRLHAEATHQRDYLKRQLADTAADDPNRDELKRQLVESEAALQESHIIEARAREDLAVARIATPPDPAAVTAARRAVEDAQIELDSLVEGGEGTVKAPIDGVLTITGSTATIAPSNLQASAEIEAIDAFRLRSQLPASARLRLSGIDAPEYLCAALRIESAGDSESGPSLVCDAEDDGGVLLPGLPVLVVIEIGSRDDVVAVPLTAVGTSDTGGFFVTEVAGDRLSEVQVEVGLSDGIYIEIIEGIEEGAVVRDNAVSRDPSDGGDGQTSTTTEN